MNDDTTIQTCKNCGSANLVWNAVPAYCNECNKDIYFKTEPKSGVVNIDILGAIEEMGDNERLVFNNIDLADAFGKKLADEVARQTATTSMSNGEHNQLTNLLVKQTIEHAITIGTARFEKRK
jgi:hypothetical protein